MSTPAPRWPAGLAPFPGMDETEATPAFAQPWQAQVFALTLALHARGLLAWADWAQALGEQVRVAPAAPGEDAASAYWRQWLGALEGLLARLGLSDAGELLHWQGAWAAAARRTPHGQPIELMPQDMQGDPLACASPSA